MFVITADGAQLVHRTAVVVHNEAILATLHMNLDDMVRRVKA
jgi:hypothetical protein